MHRCPVLTLYYVCVFPVFVARNYESPDSIFVMLRVNTQKGNMNDYHSFLQLIVLEFIFK